VRVLLVQRSLAPPGGGNAVAAWMLHALAGEHQAGTLTLGDWSVTATNAFYGTSIHEQAIARHVVTRPWSYLAALPDERGRHLSMCALLRHVTPLSDHYDLLITADNFGAFVKPGIQYLHYPIALHHAGSNALMRGYFRAAERLAGVPWRNAARNVTLANSAWTAAGLAREHGIEAQVLYPPVVDPGEGLPWEQRRNVFLCIGRFHGSKRIEHAMSIVQRVRAHAIPDARLILVGSAVDRDYTKRLRHAAARDLDWIEFREDLSRADINRLIGECRYGVQAMIDEHFGMATAEMARGGCLVFAHDSGGSREVLAGEHALLWRTDDDAVARIRAVARDAPLRDALRWTLREHGRRFSTGTFVDRMRAIARSWESGELAKRGVAQ
jgi:glycosyltransferase involved in cell wall biosynthesis